MKRIQEKHPLREPGQGLALLLEKEAFLSEQRGHRSVLEHRRNELRERLSELDGETKRLTAALTGLGAAAVDWGDLRRISPLSPVWGLDRGGPVDRHFIEKFLEKHKEDIRGRVVEIKDSGYATRFGEERVERIDVLDVDPQNPRATLVADLSQPGAVPAGQCDCFVFTQTLHIIYDFRRVLESAYKLLKPGGVLLCTVPCVSRVSNEDGGLDNGDFWRFTEASVRALFSEQFGAAHVEVTPHGNLMVCAAFLLGLAPGELSGEKLDETDPSFPLICTIRAVKAATEPDAAEVAMRVNLARLPHTGTVLLYHRIGGRHPDVHRLCVDTDMFRQHMRRLRTDWTPLPLHDLVDRARQGTLPERAVAVTFDDGYLEHLTMASPVLVEYGIPATFFVNTERLEEEHEAYWDVLERIFLSDHIIPTSLDLHGDGSWVRSTASDEDRRTTHRALVEQLYPLASGRRTSLVNRLIDWSGLTLRPRPTHRRLTADEIRQLADKPGHDIGVHTVHHLALPHRAPEIQRAEIEDCLAELEDIVGRRLRSFAYPYGDYSRLTLEVVRTLHLELAVTTEGASVGMALRPWLVPRLEVTADNQHSVLERIEASIMDRFTTTAFPTISAPDPDA
jgi:peptidoglycan/xylan/chitin deacetylase (PgdA/CDA1 family)/SAM-dependent methyltransferase